MNTLGWLLILGGAALLRQVTVGRADSLPSDARDFFTALFRGDGSALTEIGTRRGTSLTPIPDTSGGSPGSGGGGSSALIAEMRRLAGIAKNRYDFGATGPNAYDCSGLIWTAMKNIGMYTGPRFTTSTWETAANKIGAVRVSSPQTGDIVVWPPAFLQPGHMGIVVGPDRMYSAMNSKDGIGESSISGFRSGIRNYWRLPNGAT